MNLLASIGLQRLTFLLWMKLSHWRNLWVNELAGFGLLLLKSPLKSVGTKGLMCLSEEPQKA